MKKYVSFFTLLLALPVMAQTYPYSTSCDVRIKHNNCGPCPDKITLKLFDDQLQNHLSLVLDEMIFSYQVDPTMTYSNEQADQVAVYGGSSSGRYVYVMRTNDDHFPSMNGYKIWLSNNQKNAHARSDSCYYTCGLALTKSKK